MNAQQDRKWNFGDEALLYSYVGQAYSNTPEDLERIALEKALYDAPHVEAMLSLHPDDIVVDLGSGYGHVAKVIAPKVKAYNCCDISSRMLEKCMASTAGLSNVSYHTIERSDLSPIANSGANKIFANSVFIHLNLFDITLYLDQVARILPTGGLVYFNIQDADIFAIQEDPNFSSMRGRYIADPLEITLMIWNSLATIRGYALRRGLELRKSSVWKYCANSVTFEKVG